MAVRDVFNGEYFDWYQGTFVNGRMPVDKISNDPHLSRAATLLQRAQNYWGKDLVDIVEATPVVKQYSHAANLVRGSHTVLHVCWGGSNSGVHFRSTGAVSHDVATWLQSEQSGYQASYGVSRADVRMDMCDPAAWEYLYSLSADFALARKIKTNSVGDWLTGEKGRTFYIGSKTSVVQTRIYEKGKEAGGNPDWVRLEAQVRPSKADQKLKAAMWSSHDFFVHSSRWLADYYQKVLLEDHGRPEIHLGTVWSKSDAEKALTACVRQYGNRLLELAERLDGNWSRVGEVLGDMYVLVKESNQGAGFGENPYEAAIARYK